MDVRRGPHKEMFPLQMELGLDGVTDMDRLVKVEKQAPREAARRWMKANESRVAGWLKA